MLRVLRQQTQLKRNIAAGSSQAIAGVVLAAVSYRLYLGWLGYELYGVWLAVGVILAVAQFGNLGIAPALMKLVAEEHGKGDTAAVRSYISTAVVMLTLTVGLIAVIVIALRHQLVGAMRLNPDCAVAALRILPWVAILSIYVIQVDAINSVLAGLGRMDIASTLQICTRMLNVGIAAAMLAGGCGLYGMVIASFVSNSILLGATGLMVRRLTGLNCFTVRGFNRHALGRICSFGSGIFACSVINACSLPLSRIMLTRYAGVASVPVYELAWTVAMQLRGILDSGLRAVMPEISRLNASSNPAVQLRIHRLRRQSIRTAIRVGLPVCLAGAALAGPGLKVWLGTRFHPMLPSTLWILLLGTLASVAAVPAYYALLAMERVRHLIISHLIFAGVNLIVVGGLIVTTSRLSLSAVAAAATLGLAATSSYLLLITRRDLLCSNTSGPDHLHEERRLLVIPR